MKGDRGVTHSSFFRREQFLCISWNIMHERVAFPCSQPHAILIFYSILYNIQTMNVQHNEHGRLSCIYRIGIYYTYLVRIAPNENNERHWGWPINLFNDYSFVNRNDTFHLSVIAGLSAREHLCRSTFFTWLIDGTIMRHRWKSNMSREIRARSEKFVRERMNERAWINYNFAGQVV